MMTSLGTAVGADAPASTAAAAQAPSIPNEEYTLDNGLQVILAPDDSTPIVFVQVWYKVGSADEKPGLTGFAHLFEHLMFQGSEHTGPEYFTPLQKIGGEVNGSTSFDRTEYHEQVPSQYLPLALFMESDRMGWFLPALDQSKLDNQRQVVLNERRQNYENPPYGSAMLDLYAAAWPEGHPYHHMPIGSAADIEHADLASVQGFFKTWYLPNNASLVISGSFDEKQAKALVEKYFGAIPKGTDPQHATAQAAAIPQNKVIREYQDVPERKFWAAWISPKLYAPGDADLDLLSMVLAGGKDSRLYQVLVKDKQIAKDISARQFSMGLGSLYILSGTAAKGHTTDEVLEEADQVIGHLLSDQPPTDEEIQAAKSSYEVGFYQGLTTVTGKGMQLSSYNAMAGTPDYMAKDLARYQQATTDDVVSWGQKVLRQPRVLLHIWPLADKPADAPADAPQDEENK